MYPSPGLGGHQLSTDGGMLAVPVLEVFLNFGVVIEDIFIVQHLSSIPVHISQDPVVIYSVECSIHGSGPDIASIKHP